MYFLDIAVYDEAFWEDMDNQADALVLLMLIWASQLNKMLRKYSPIIGPMTKAIFTGSTVGVMTAAKTEIKTTAKRHCFNNVFGWINPITEIPKINNGNSNATPIQNIKLVTKS